MRKRSSAAQDNEALTRYRERSDESHDTMQGASHPLTARGLYYIRGWPPRSALPQVPFFARSRLLSRKSVPALSFDKYDLVTLPSFIIVAVCVWKCLWIINDRAEVLYFFFFVFHIRSGAYYSVIEFYNRLYSFYSSLFHILWIVIGRARTSLLRIKCRATLGNYWNFFSVHHSRLRWLYR